MEVFDIICIIFTVFFPCCFLSLLFIFSIKMKKDDESYKFEVRNKDNVISKKEVYENSISITFDYD